MYNDIVLFLIGLALLIGAVICTVTFLTVYSG
jgi:nitrogen fixation-related uncharacterized protein